MRWNVAADCLRQGLNSRWEKSLFSSLVFSSAAFFLLPNWPTEAKNKIWKCCTFPREVNWLQGLLHVFFFFFVIVFWYVCVLVSFAGWLSLRFISWVADEKNEEVQLLAAGAGETGEEEIRVWRIAWSAWGLNILKNRLQGRAAAAFRDKLPADSAALCYTGVNSTWQRSSRAVGRVSHSSHLFLYVKWAAEETLEGTVRKI